MKTSSIGSTLSGCTFVRSSVLTTTSRGCLDLSDGATQCAAVSTQRAPISVAPQRTLFVDLSRSATNEAQSEILAGTPPRILSRASAAGTWTVSRAAMESPRHKFAKDAPAKVAEGLAHFWITAPLEHSFPASISRRSHE